MKVHAGFRRTKKLLLIAKNDGSEDLIKELVAGVRSGVDTE